MKHAKTIKTLALTATCLVGAQTASPASYRDPSETALHVMRAEQDGDRSELPFLEATALGEENKEIGRGYAAKAYIQIATLDETTVFMRKLYSTVEYLSMGKFG